MSLKPLEVYGHIGAPNPWKVVTIVEELGLAYNYHTVDFSEVKKEPYLKINPNGRLPAVQDPNTGITLWESGAIILYLIDQYDKEGRISYNESPQKYLTQQWLMFQVSGQGPYYGQATWFARFHPEKIQSATNRYVNEIFRVIGVLDSALQDRAWLVGGKCTYADLAFVTWADVGKGLLAQLGKDAELERYPSYNRWMDAMAQRTVLKSVAERVASGRAKLNLR